MDRVNRLKRRPSPSTRIENLLEAYP